MIISGHGQISRLALPPGFEEVTRAQPSTDCDSVDSLREFICAEAPGVRICLYYRGSRLTPLSGLKFLEVIKSSPHELTDKEYLDLSEVLGNASYPEYFTKHHAQTVDLGSKRVLIIEGRWLASEKMSLNIMLSADETGRYIQEIGIDAPEQGYQNHLETIRNALQTIQWL